MKKHVLFVSLLIACLVFSVSPAFAQTTTPLQEQETSQMFSNATSIQFVPEFQFTIVSEKKSESISGVEIPQQFIVKTTLVEVKWEEATTPDSPTDKKVTASFQHNIFDRNGVLMATVYTPVIGWYNLNENLKAMESVTVTSITGPFASNVSTSTALDSEYGYLSLYFDGVYLTTITYQVMFGYIK